MARSNPAEKGKLAWQYIAGSYQDSFITGHESPVDEIGTGKERPKVEDPVRVFEALEHIAARLAEVIDDTNNPMDLYGNLMRSTPGFVEEEGLPKEVQETITRLMGHISRDVKTIYAAEEIDCEESLDAATQRVIRDIKTISGAPLTDEEILNSIQVRRVPVDEIPRLREILPQIDQLTEFSGIKGGAARLALKLHTLNQMHPMDEKFDALVRSIDAELPLADIDLMITDDAPDKQAFAESMGVHPVDIETIHNFDQAALIDHFGRRDLASNQALLTQDELIFTQLGQSSLRIDPDKAESVVSTFPGLFGRESFVVAERMYLAANTLYRLTKMVAEGKHAYYEAPRYNLDAITIGKYWLTMARKWMKRPDRAEVFARAHSCAKQMGRTTAETPAEFLEELLEESPDFEFGNEQTIMDVAKWLTKKYVTFLQKILRRKFRLRPENANEVFANDDDTTVRVQPDISEVDEDQLAAVEAVFKRITPPEKKLPPEMPVTASKEAAQAALAEIANKREEDLAEIQAELDEMRAQGIQVDMRVQAGDMHSQRVLKVTGTHVFLDSDYTWILAEKIPLEAFEPQYTRYPMGGDCEWVRKSGFPREDLTEAEEEEFRERQRKLDEHRRRNSRWDW